MITALIQATPSKSATIYTAATLIEKCGPMQRCELFAKMNFGPSNNREAKLREAFETDWLRETPSGHIELTEFSKRHLAGQKPKVPYAGQVAPPAYRGNVFGKTLDRRHIPDRRGPRADAPAAYGANPTFHRG